MGDRTTGGEGEKYAILASRAAKTRAFMANRGLPKLELYPSIQATFSAFN
jgi:hypothetical protein